MSNIVTTNTIDLSNKAKYTVLYNKSTLGAFSIYLNKLSNIYDAIENNNPIYLVYADRIVLKEENVKKSLIKITH